MKIEVFFWGGGWDLKEEMYVGGDGMGKGRFWGGGGRVFSIACNHVLQR